jgi:hypothetical protein
VRINLIDFNPFDDLGSVVDFDPNPAAFFVFTNAEGRPAAAEWVENKVALDR